MSMKLTHGRAVALMIAVTMMWSIAGVVTRQLEQARSFEVTFWRSFFTAASLLVILPLWQGWGVWRRMHWRSVYFWLSACCWCVMFTAFMVAITLTTVANVLITLALGPLLTALVSRIFLAHRLHLRTWGAIVVAGLGIAWIFASQVQLAGDGHASPVAGMLVALLVPCAGAIQWTLTQRSQAQGQELDLVPCVFIGAVLSALLTAPAAWPLSASGTDIAWLAVLGVVQLAIPCVLSVVCARVLKAPEVALLALLEILFGITWAWLGAHETPAPNVLIGGALVMGALLMNETLGLRERTRSAL